MAAAQPPPHDVDGILHTMQDAKQKLADYYREWVTEPAEAQVHGSGEALSATAMRLFRIKYEMDADGTRVIGFVTTLEPPAQETTPPSSEFNDWFGSLADSGGGPAKVPRDAELVHHMQRRQLGRLQKIWLMFVCSGQVNYKDAPSSAGEGKPRRAARFHIDDDVLDRKWNRLSMAVLSFCEILTNVFGAMSVLSEPMYDEKTAGKLGMLFVNTCQVYSNWDKEMNSFQRSIQYIYDQCQRYKLRKLNGRLYEQIRLVETTVVYRLRECEDGPFKQYPLTAEKAVAHIMDTEGVDEGRAMTMRPGRMVCHHCHETRDRHGVLDGQTRRDHAFTPLLHTTPGGRIFNTCAWCPIDATFNPRVRRFVRRQGIGICENTRPRDSLIESFIDSITQYVSSMGQWKNITDRPGHVRDVARHLAQKPIAQLPFLSLVDGSWAFLNGIFATAPPQEAVPGEDVDKIRREGGRFFPYAEIQGKKWTETFNVSKFLPWWCDEDAVQMDMRGRLVQARTENTTATYSREIPYELCGACGASTYRHNARRCLDVRTSQKHRGAPLRPGDVVVERRGGGAATPTELLVVLEIELDWALVCPVGDAIRRRGHAYGTELKDALRDEFQVRELPVAELERDTTTETGALVRVPGCAQCFKCAPPDKGNAGEDAGEGRHPRRPPRRGRARPCLWPMCACRDGPRTTTLRPDAWYDIQTPCFDQILEYQFREVQDKVRVKKVVYAMLGRLFFSLKEYDNWQCVFMIKGEAASGKSTIGQFIQDLFQPDAVCILSSNCQQKFGLASLIDQSTKRPKSLTICFEVKKNFGVNVSQADFQSIVSGESVSVNIKNAGTVQVDNWDRPLFLLGNETPGYADTSNSVARRFVTVGFENPVKENMKDGKLMERLKEREGYALIRKCVMAYQCMAALYGQKTLTGRDDHTKEKILPDYFIDRQLDMRKETHLLLGFLLSDPKTTRKDCVKVNREEYVFDARFYVTLDQFRADWKAWCAASQNIPAGQLPAFNRDFYGSVFKLMNLKLVTNVCKPWRPEERDEDAEGGQLDCGRVKAEPNYKASYVVGIGIRDLMVDVASLCCCPNPYVDCLGCCQSGRCGTDCKCVRAFSGHVTSEAQYAMHVASEGTPQAMQHRDDTAWEHALATIRTAKSLRVERVAEVLQALLGRSQELAAKEMGALLSDVRTRENFVDMLDQRDAVTGNYVVPDDTLELLAAGWFERRAALGNGFHPDPPVACDEECDECGPAPTMDLVESPTRQKRSRSGSDASDLGRDTRRQRLSQERPVAVPGVLGGAPGATEPRIPQQAPERP